MTDPNYTALLFVIDRSGSMQSIKSDTEGGLKALLSEQAELDGKATVDIAYFDTEFTYDTEFALLASADVKVVPRGGTALYDAIVRATAKFGAALEALPEDERPGKVIVVVATDGEENSSRESTSADVKSVITEQTDKYGWDFVFLGANQDAVTNGVNLGFKGGSSLTYAPSAAGVAHAHASLSNYVTRTRSGGNASFTDADRDAASQS